MNIIGILLLGFLGILILIFGFLAYEIWSVLQIYHTVTDVASVKNLKKIQKVALWIVKWWKDKRSKVALWPILMLILVASCGPSKQNNLIPMLSESGDTVWYTRVCIIDSCEYLKSDGKLTHKGNCKYCKTRRNEEINRIINALSTHP